MSGRILNAATGRRDALILIVAAASVWMLFFSVLGILGFLGDEPQEKILAGLLVVLVPTLAVAMAIQCAALIKTLRARDTVVAAIEAEPEDPK